MTILYYTSIVYDDCFETVAGDLSENEENIQNSTQTLTGAQDRVYQQLFYNYLSQQIILLNTPCHTENKKTIIMV